jgi:uncharacterized protein HemX
MAENSDEDSSDEPDENSGESIPPAREPPLRSTAPQSSFTPQQAGAGLVVLAVGLLVVFGLALVLA